jgi:hypothetical protein
MNVPRLTAGKRFCSGKIIPSLSSLRPTQVNDLKRILSAWIATNRQRRCRSLSVAIKWHQSVLVEWTASPVEQKLVHFFNVLKLNSNFFCQRGEGMEKSYFCAQFMIFAH